MKTRATAARPSLRIAHITPAFPPYLSGVSTVVAAIAALGVGLGHDVHVLTGRRGEPERVATDPPGVTVDRLRAAFRIGNAPFTPSLALLDRFDLIHLHYPWYFGAELLWLGQLRSRTPMLVTYHHDVVFQGLLARVDALHRATVGPMVLRRAARVTTATMDYARHSSLWRQMGRQTGKIVELGYPIDTAHFSPGPPDPMLAQRAAGEGLLLLFVAALDRAHYHKGLGALLTALADPGVPPARLLVVGEGEELPRYQAQSRALGLEGRVHFLGRQSDAGLVAALRTCDALILPSETQSEAFGMVVLEAMACGKPTIISALPGLRTLPPSEGASLMFQPPLAAAELRRCLAELTPEGFRRRLGEAARSKALACYHRDVIADQLDRLYQAVARR